MKKPPYHRTFPERLQWHIIYLPDNLVKLPHRIRLELRHWWQRRTRGWDDTDCWSLDFWLCKALAARMPRMKEMKGEWLSSEFSLPGDPLRADGNLTEEAYAMGMARQNAAFDAMIEGFQIAATEPTCWMRTPEQQEKVQRAFDLLAKHHHMLWD